MSNTVRLLYTKVRFARDVAKAARTQVYGLHYSIDWELLYFLDLVIKSMEVSTDNPTDYYALTEAQITTMLSKIYSYSGVTENKAECYN